MNDAGGVMVAVEEGVLGRFLEAVNTCDEAALGVIFAEGATVSDGGLRYAGEDAAIRWLRESNDRYALRLRGLGMREQEGRWVLETMAYGTFEGSPVRLECGFTLVRGRVVRLEI